MFTYVCILLLNRLDAECLLAVADVTEAHIQKLMQNNSFREKIRELIVEVLVEEAVDSFSETEDREEYHTCNPTVSRCSSTEHK